MDLNPITKKIAAAKHQENIAHNLATAIAQFVKLRSGSENRQLQQVLHVATVKYIEAVPDLLKKVRDQAGEEGVLAHMNPIFDAITNYFTNDFDVIPDHFGLLGLTDDAYLAHKLMEQASNNYQAKTGRPLLQESITDANTFMRTMIGEPHASILDGIVNTTLNGPNIQQAIQQLAALQRFQPMAWNTPDPIYGNASVQEIANARLGAMGVI